jgi:hypothetical protein
MVAIKAFGIPAVVFFIIARLVLIAIQILSAKLIEHWTFAISENPNLNQFYLNIYIILGLLEVVIAGFQTLM